MESNAVSISQAIREVADQLKRGARKKIKIGSWVLEKDGTMLHDNPYYYIEGGSLTATDWIPHMAAKNWVNIKTFLHAYLVACRVRGIKHLTIDTETLYNL